MQSTNARTRLTRCMAVTTRLRRSPHPPRGWRIQVAVLTVIWAGLRTAWAGRAGAAWGRGTPAAPRGRGSCSQPGTRRCYRYSGQMCRQPPPQAGTRTPPPRALRRGAGARCRAWWSGARAWARPRRCPHTRQSSTGRCWGNL